LRDQGFQWRGNILTLHIYIQPNASRNAFAGFHDNYLKISVKAPPIEGKANEQLVAFLSKLFSVPKKAVRLQQGSRSRYKTVSIDNPEQLPDWISPQSNWNIASRGPQD
jgi:uncharacterized protein (TIGR00251 family)